MIGSHAEITILTIMIATVVVLIAALSFRKYEKRRDKLSKLPPFFTSFVMSQSAISLDDSLKEQLSKYGKIFTSRFYGQKIVISADHDLNSYVLKNEKILFDSYIPSLLHTLVGKNGFFLPAEDKRYKRMKSMLLSFLHSWQIQTSCLEEVQKVADQVLSSWSHNDTILFSDETERFNFNIIAKKCVGLTADDPEGKELRIELSALAKGGFTPSIQPVGVYRRALKARKNIITIIKKRVESKKMEEKNTKPKDWMDWLQENDPHASEDSFYDAIIQLCVAGLSTSAKAIALAVYFMGNCPKAVQQMREEYQQVLRAKKDDIDKLVWDDYLNLKFTQCVINETLRLGNVVTIIPKKAKQDIHFKSFVIPQGTPIMIYFQATHLDPTAFEKPEIFNPWRWQGVSKMNSWMAFGGGVRQCNGEQFARMQIAIFLHRFLLKYNWDFVEPDHPTIDALCFLKKLPIRVYPINPVV